MTAKQSPPVSGHGKPEWDQHAFAAQLAEDLPNTQLQMETAAERLRSLILTQPLRTLLAYVQAQLLQQQIHAPEQEVGVGPTVKEALKDMQFLLEMMHAAHAASPGPDEPRDDDKFDEAVAEEIIACSRDLEQKVGSYAMLSSIVSSQTHFGPDTQSIEARAKFAWVLLRGNRYQQLEGEFYGYVLRSHDAMLRAVYGVGNTEIASGIQRIADVQRTGHLNALLALKSLQEKFAREMEAPEGGNGEPDQAAAKTWLAAHRRELDEAFTDAMTGGTSNVTRHSGLPEALLTDLSCRPGTEPRFYADGPLRGTPFRTLPVRMRPLLELEGNHYALDPCMLRDGGYRGIVQALHQRCPGERQAIRTAQKEMCERAFVEVFAQQLRGAQVHHEVFYRIPDTKDWAEVDTLIVLEDVLIVIEAKSGAAATIASPATDFDRHAQAIRDLILGAHRQCTRFASHLAAAEEVPIHARREGAYVEVDRLRLSDYRLVLPICLTVESIAPFSAMAKTLPGVSLILDRHAFLSMAVDDLFVLRRFLPTTGALVHYLEVRQAAAADARIELYDELDNLGAYVTRNRYDQAYGKEADAHSVHFMAVDGASKPIDAYFEEITPDPERVPIQEMPNEMAELLAALDSQRPEGWLRMDGLLRDHGLEARTHIGAMLRDGRTAMATRSMRRGILTGDAEILLWFERIGHSSSRARVHEGAIGAAHAVRASSLNVLHVLLDSADAVANVHVDCVTARPVQAMSSTAKGDSKVFEASLARHASQEDAAPRRKTGRNEPCWCGSGIKFKRCHGQ